MGILSRKMKMMAIMKSTDTTMPETVSNRFRILTIMVLRAITVASGVLIAVTVN